MVFLVKGTALFLIAVVAACAASECKDPPPCKEPPPCQEPEPYVPRPKAPQQTVKVCQPARAIVPINIETEDYCGPYDPFDPKGIWAARKRELKLKGQGFLNELKSYYPKGLVPFLKKEGIKLALNEGRRFATCHPIETGMLVDLALKAKKLYSTCMAKVEKECGCCEEKKKTC